MEWTWLFVGCMAIAIIYLRFAPRPLPVKTPVDRFMNFVLRWFHSLTWFFFALFCLVRMAALPSLYELGFIFAIVGGLIYFLFLGVFLFSRFSRRR